MVAINTDVETMDVKHPKHSEVVATVRVLDPIETMEIFSALSRYRKVVVLTHPVTGEILYDDEQNPLTSTLTNIPADAAIEVLEKTLIRVKGLTDGNKKPIVIDLEKNPESRENLKYLFKKQLNVSIVRKKKNTEGKEISTPGTQSFPDFLQAEINKRAELEDSNDPN